MTSSDNQQYVTVEMFNAGIESLRAEIRRGNEQMREIRAEVQALDRKVELNAHDIEHVQTSIYWGFAIMALVISLVGFVVTLAPMFKEMYKESRKSAELEKKSLKQEQEIRDLREEFARLKLGRQRRLQ